MRGQCPTSAGRSGRLVGALALGAMSIALLLAAVARSAAETRIALVIGNGAYAWGRLDNPRADAELIAKALVSVGFQVTTVLDGDDRTMRRAVVEFGRRLKTADAVGLFYFAGHGVQVAGENYLVPIGADIADEGEIALQSMNLAEVLRTMASSRSRTNIVVLDACRNNPFASARDRSASGGLAPVSAPSGTIIAFATAPGHVASDGDGANSPYSAALAANIPVEGIVLEEVFRRTRRHVLAATNDRQTPWEHSSLTGEFYFRPTAARPETSRRLSDVGFTEAQVAEIRAWEHLRDERDPVQLIRHLETYPNGLFAEVVRLRLADAASAQAAAGPVVAGWIGEIVPTAATVAEAERELAEGLKLEAGTRPGDELEAVRRYRIAADFGLPAAMHQLARAYDRGRGVERNLAEAAHWYRRAGELGHAPSLAALGTMHEFGEGVPVNLVEALRLYTSAAEAGDADGMTSLAYLVEQGKGVAKDPAIARQWYGRAAARGHKRAMYNLALMQLRGEGGERDFGEAARLLKGAVQRGHIGAMRELAYLLDEGRGTARDPKAAAELLLAAFKAGHRDARTDILSRPQAWSAATRREIQRRLAASGHYDGRITGFFDARTRRAAEAYARS